MQWNTLLSFSTLLLSACMATAKGGAMPGMENAIDIQREQLEHLRDFLGPVAITGQPTKRQDSIMFSNPAAEQFFVDGTKIPDG
jgi:carboxypeptidase D